MVVKFVKHSTQLSFEQNGPNKETLSLNKYWNLYVSSCFFYTFSGLVRFYQGSKIDGINLIIQSFLSYKSDVSTIGLKSHWHLLDRYFAIIISIYHFYSLKTYKTFIINFILFLIGFHLLKKSIKLYEDENEQFLIEHIKWHCVAPLMALTSNF